jgi:hypothetical protein
MATHLGWPPRAAIVFAMIAGGLVPVPFARAEGERFSPTTAVTATDFLKSLGACSAVSVRGENLKDTAASASYLGLRWLRVVFDECAIEDLIALYRQTGIKVSFGLGSGNADLDKFLIEAAQLAEAGALLALEGNNEPNNWPINYKGVQGGGLLSWRSVAALQRDLYQAVKSSPALKDYPVWHVSEVGAEQDNVGLQYLRVPAGADALMPDGTRYSDFANCHNYLFHPDQQQLRDNQAWVGADPTADDGNGLFTNYGVTWLRQFRGYSPQELLNLPRVTTETGCKVGEYGVTEHLQGALFLSIYLSQFKRHWSHTSIYLLRDRTDEDGNQAYGFFSGDYRPRLSAKYLHQLTAVLADQGVASTARTLNYHVDTRADTVHDLLMQKSDGSLWLIVWSERFTGGSDAIKVRFATPHDEVRIYDPTKGVAPEHSLRQVSTVELSLTDHPLVLELR